MPRGMRRHRLAPSFLNEASTGCTPVGGWRPVRLSPATRRDCSQKAVDKLLVTSFGYASAKRWEASLTKLPKNRPARVVQIQAITA